MRVSFDVPDKMWWRLANIADMEGKKVEDVAADALLNLVQQPAQVTILESVLRLHTKGLTTPEIARELSMTNAAVSSRLYAQGLRGNRKAS